MIIFEPRFTEVIFFDIECYVPPQDREKLNKSSLVFNAANLDHFILGGVFRRWFPLKDEPEPAVKIWNFEKNFERSTLGEIYKYFIDSWQMIDRRNRRDNPDLILIGTGINRLDIPALYVRSAMHNIDSKRNLYETYFKAKTVDLGEVAILLAKNATTFPLYPWQTDDLLKELGIKSAKLSGTRVWKMFDNKDFEGIRARTAAEVEDSLAMANEIINRCKSQQS